MRLTLGATTTSVEVDAAIQQLQTESSTVSAGVGALAIEIIPNITENPLYYTTLENNVQPRNELAMSVGMGTYNNAFGIGVAGRAEFSAIGVNGGRAFTNDIQLDGLPITGTLRFNEAAILPNQEGLQEVRVVNNNFTADYGHGQAVLEMTTKSGTNTFHGQLNYLMRNDGLNANGFSNNQLGIPSSPADDIVASRLIWKQAVSSPASLSEIQRRRFQSDYRAHGAREGRKLHSNHAEGSKRPALSGTDIQSICCLANRTQPVPAGTYHARDHHSLAPS